MSKKLSPSVFTSHQDGGGDPGDGEQEGGPAEGQGAPAGEAGAGCGQEEGKARTEQVI